MALSHLPIQSQIKSLCEKEGFSFVGFTKAEIPEKDLAYLENWIAEKKHGNMDWFAKDHALSIRNRFENLGFKPLSAICLGFVYRSSEGEGLLAQMQRKVSRYALGTDYHIVLRKKGNQILKELKALYPQNHFRQSVDSLPIAEKILTRESKIVWQGKHTNLIHPKLGSYFFLSIILTDLELGDTNPLESTTDHCGSCRRCLDVCPTNALEPYQLDASKCISYLTIEDRTHTEVTGSFLQWEKKGWVYGCDLCQEVCPWNEGIAKRNQVETIETSFLPREFWKDPAFQKKQKLSEEEFQTYFQDSPIERIGVSIWNRNQVEK
ncbi:tRNA epoxyqueuosine(34) reductase QueG [Leptospira levettii]|uniref:tRNA epoxyqueuosine(34) reductase QueG n=1 Tax=Leptospira levettii TaxID=2023178 RepID=UPI000C2B278E|nr:tRNA epoxyqueuosine(34) reductase QueG [Leptospira levettii]MCW7475112.1 tRNA epoxyqueuosine(34) reductase QueG [Leptospira levettii]PJZ36776.1 tRNA epoxyqueuosine(34) reductase QueG [Leptospira levettii]PJZ88069.1 tRNA epoxyqueuosine(34) reductase QueG [Leptospira levettii]PKA00182.1 tRNA epoxyqueuosine(34) reductase QueG [Leptospira levettii]